MADEDDALLVGLKILLQGKEALAIAKALKAAYDDPNGLWWHLKDQLDRGVPVAVDPEDIREHLDEFEGIPAGVTDDQIAGCILEIEQQDWSDAIVSFKDAVLEQMRNTKLLIDREEPDHEQPAKGQG